MPLGHARLQALALASGVPFTTLWKVRSGETANPGIETVRKFLPHLPELADPPTPPDAPPQHPPRDAAQVAAGLQLPKAA